MWPGEHYEENYFLWKKFKVLISYEVFGKFLRHTEKNCYSGRFVKTVFNVRRNTCGKVYFIKNTKIYDFWRILRKFFPNNSQKSYFRQFCEKPHATCPAFGKKNYFNTVIFLIFFRFRSNKLLNFGNMIATGFLKRCYVCPGEHSEQNYNLWKKHKILTSYGLVGNFFRTSAKTCCYGSLVETSMQPV